MIVTIAIGVLSVFLILTVVQVRRSAKEVETTLKNIEEELTPLLSRLRETIENFQHISSKIDSGVTATANVIKTIENTAKNISHASSFLSAKNFARKILASGMWVGVKAGYDVVKKRYAKK